MTPMPDRSSAAFFDCSSRVKFRITGADSVRFLNGQITNDLRKATQTSAIQASVLNAKGKLSAHVFVAIDSAGAFVLDAEPELHEDLPARLERYIIADDVQLEDVTAQFSIFHLTGDSAPGIAGSARMVSSNRFGVPGWDLWFDPTLAAGLRRELSDQFAFCDDGCAEVFRIERGIPRWGRELTNDIIPVEANLETAAIDYSKGCYIGQEVISRMKMSGQTNKRLCGLVSLSNAPLEANMRLRNETDPSKDAGWITSATRSVRLGKEIALGYVKRGYNSIGTCLLARSGGDSEGNAGIPVEVVSLPFS
jgi:folate-binding protein YgfZ